MRTIDYKISNITYHNRFIGSGVTMFHFGTLSLSCGPTIAETVVVQDRSKCLVSLFCPIVSVVETSVFCWLQIKEGPSVVSVFLYVVQSNFQPYSELDCESIVTEKIKHN